MRKIVTEVLIIGGGSTGAAVLRDLAMRGFKAVLVEKRRLNDGTTGRYHGLLHSGGRYAVTDPAAAGECAEENRILRRLMPHAIDDSGGFFVITPQDDPSFGDAFHNACQETGVAVTEVSVAQMLREEPALNPDISRCFWVPDAVSYADIATEATVRSAVENGAEVLLYHTVTELLRERNRIVGVRCYDETRGEEVTIEADTVVNATGALAGRIAAMAGIAINIIPGKGTMVAVNHVPLKTVINRCRPPSDGDILVPLQQEAVIGTTDIEVEDPEQFGVTAEEIAQMLAAGETLIPGYSQTPVLRAWAGVRPLYQPGDADDDDHPREVTRSYALLDHASRDGIDGFITITGGKWTTHRLMAEETVDLVCQKLGVERPCRTHLESLPGG